MEAAWFRASQWELTSRGWGNAQRQEDNRTVCGICGAPVCLPPAFAFRGEENHGHLKHRKAKCARVHILTCLRVTGPERTLIGHQTIISFGKIWKQCIHLSYSTYFILGNSSQKNAKLLLRAATHPLPLSDQSRSWELTAFRTGSADTEKGRTTS